MTEHFDFLKQHKILTVTLLSLIIGVFGLAGYFYFDSYFAANVCDACGSIQPDMEIDSAEEWLDQRHSDLSILESEAMYAGCAPCNEVSATAFPVVDNNNETVGVIKVREREVINFTTGVEEEDFRGHYFD